MMNTKIVKSTLFYSVNKLLYGSLLAIRRKIKKNIKLCFFGIFAILSLFPLQAEKVSIEKAESIAKSYVYLTPRLHQQEEIQLNRTVSKQVHKGKFGSASYSQQETPMYYVFNMDKGFIIVAGDDVAMPILGYSEDGTYDESNPNFMYWMECMTQEITSAIENGISQDSSTKSLWETLNGNLFALASSADYVEPLLKTHWNQDSPYNANCPKISDKSTYTGCVATAMAQIMKYYRHPTNGTGSHSYKHSSVGNISANFGSTTYEWGDMANRYSSSNAQAQKDAVATLMFHCGVSVDMNYGTGSSGAYSKDVAGALASYFNYDAGISYLLRSYYSHSEWSNMIKTELKANRLVYYAGQGSGGGHAFVCDGYDTNDLFHINWGWGGSSDGYFELSALNPNALGIGGGSGGYNSSQSIIIGIKPSDGGTLDIRLGLSSLSSSKTSLSSITGTFNVIATKLKNIGANVINSANSVYLGALLCDQNNMPINNSYKKSLYTSLLSLGAYYSSYTLYSNYSLPSNLPAGTYKLYGAYSLPSVPNVPIIIPGENGNKYVTVVVSNDGKVTLSANSDSPNLTLNSLDVVGNLYQNKNGNFSATITNNGISDYNSRLIINLNSQVITDESVIIPAGATKNIGFSGLISLSPGNYSLSILYDPNNNQNTPSTQLGNAYSVSVTQTPPAPVLSVQSFSFPDVNNVQKNDPDITVQIKNTGGIYENSVENSVTVFIFPVGGGTSLTSLGRKSISIENNETESVNFHNPINLPNGKYLAIAYYLNENTWTKIAPTSINYKTFTLTDNQLTVETAQEVIEEATFTVVQTTANTEADVKVWLVNQINALSGMKEAAIAVSEGNITFTAFTPAVASTQSDIAGTNGLFEFTTLLSKGTSRAMAEATGVIVSTPNALTQLIGIEYASPSKIWTSGNTLYIRAQKEGKAYIYSATTSQFVKTITHYSEETIQTILDRGIYVIVAEGKVYKIRIN